MVRRVEALVIGGIAVVLALGVGLLARRGAPPEVSPAQARRRLDAAAPLVLATAPDGAVGRVDGTFDGGALDDGTATAALDPTHADVVGGPLLPGDRVAVVGTLRRDPPRLTGAPPDPLLVVKR